MGLPCSAIPYNNCLLCKQPLLDVMKLLNYTLTLVDVMKLLNYPNPNPS